MEKEQRDMASHNNYLMAKQRAEEKRKVQDALMLQKKEEAKQAKMIK